VVVLFMALPFFVESAPRAYRLKAGNADPLLVQHSSGHPRGEAALRATRVRNARARDEFQIAARGRRDFPAITR
jgi:hypothetical protein